MFGFKLGVYAVLGVAVLVGVDRLAQSEQPEALRDAALRQMTQSDASVREYRELRWRQSALYSGALAGVGALGVLMFAGDAARLLLRRRKPGAAALALAGLLPLVASGCIRPYEPVKLETIDTSEEGFLVPLTGDTGKQQAFTSEELLAQSLVATKQVQIPHRWVKTGYDIFGDNGRWEPSAKLIKVDRSPITREWTADPNSGTSNRNEAIWAMTADQVEFSTGWTCTGRIASRTDAVKFLWNYPTGSLKQVMDTEVRARIQAIFGEAVTDKPMEELRLHATPVIQEVRKDVETFFEERGITITTLGITGGFVYKDAKILDTMVRVFQAQQEQATAKAESMAQEERNKAVKLKAEGLAEAAKLQAKGEADAIKEVADAKAYEIQKAKEDLKTYLELKQIEIEKARLEKWDGRYPAFLMGGGAGTPNMLLQMPTVGEVLGNK